MTDQTGNTNPLADASNLATVLAALRLFQRTYEDCDAEAIANDWPEHFAIEPDGTEDTFVTPEPLGTEDIDTLCEQLNCGDGIAPAPAPAKIEPGPHDARFITKAKEQYQSGSDGDIDIDDSPVVSQSDNGAYVAMWGWVSNEDACSAHYAGNLPTTAKALTVCAATVPIKRNAARTNATQP